jgi:hypothetical protein
VAAAAVLVIGYGALWSASTLREPERSRIADLAALSSRDAALLGEPGAGRLVEAVRLAERGRQSTAGLWPRYDARSLDASARALSRIAAEAPPESVRSQEARLALGRVLVHQGADAEAARVLGSLVRQGGYRGSEARRLLDWIRAGASAG